MKRLIPLLFFITAVCGAVFLTGAVILYNRLPESSSEKPLTLNPAVLDFGVVNEPRLTGKIIVTNSSKQPVIITDTLSSCSCSGVLLKKGELAAGRSIELTVFMDTHGFQGKTSADVVILYTTKNRKEPHLLPLKVLAEIPLPVVNGTQDAPKLAPPVY